MYAVHCPGCDGVKQARSALREHTASRDRNLKIQIRSNPRIPEPKQSTGQTSVKKGQAVACRATGLVPGWTKML